MTMALDLDALKAEFAARGGKATVIAQGARAIESDRTIYAAMREGKRAAADEVVRSANAERRHHVMQDAYRAAKMQGWTDEDALEYGATAAD
jgi:hypothetical protein